MNAALAPTALPRPVDAGSPGSSRGSSAGSDHAERFRRELDRASSQGPRRPSSGRDRSERTAGDRRDSTSGAQSRRSTSARSTGAERKRNGSAGKVEDAEGRTDDTEQAATAEPIVTDARTDAVPASGNGGVATGDMTDGLAGTPALTVAVEGNGAGSAQGSASAPAPATPSDDVAGPDGIVSGASTTAGQPVSAGHVGSLTDGTIAVDGEVTATSANPTGATAAGSDDAGTTATTTAMQGGATSTEATQAAPAQTGPTPSGDAAEAASPADPSAAGELDSDGAVATGRSADAVVQVSDPDDVSEPRGPDAARPTDEATANTPVARHDLAASRTDGPARIEPSTTRAPDPATTTAEQLLRADELAESLRASFRSREGTKQLSVQLHPAELGAVQIQARVVDGVTHLVLRAESAAATDRLATALDELRADLANHGVDVGDLDLRRGPTDHGPSGHGSGDRGTAGSDRAPLTAGRSAIATDPTHRPQPSIRHDAGSLALDL